MRNLQAAFGVAAAAAVAGISYGITGVALAASTPAQCSISQLTTSKFQAGAASLLSYYTVTLTNSSSRTCSVSGYPKIQLQDAAGSPMQESQAERGPSAGAVVLSSGSSADFTVVFGDDPENFGGHCNEASQFTVTLSNGRESRKIPEPLDPCQGRIQVTSFQPVP